ncbi:hypothetical protein GCM10010329_66020 [Streptomyces spiroverticillatus]|uniref:Uncharacterized protein n=1 Tax=Streptomyces finlayi TaxID=67296 RepID=A0A919CDQ9_9ACTN|nr:hypothetical protein [Streptomyces finlayi]GHA33775.1 hypothetical protein GCM10010329_66020 [Streptomyces spiroverticillatus]GHD11469.1 hypothetical protein GCM10010334_67570 [Streptomyces finlayi]
MTTTTLPTSTTTGTARPVPLWAERVAHAIPLVGLPVCIWRLPFAFGFTMGSTQEDAPWGWWMIPYVFGLSILSEAFALLSFGLVRRWGEVVPAWVPRLAGRRISPWVAIVPATIGGLIMTALLVDWVLSATLGLGGGFPYEDGWRQLAMTMSGLLNLWGPLLLILTYGYWRRRRGE